MTNSSNVYMNGEKIDLNIVKVSGNEYHQLVANGQCSKNTLYIVEDDFTNMNGERITNVANAVALYDAVNKLQLDNLKDDLDRQIADVKSSINQLKAYEIKKIVKNVINDILTDLLQNKIKAN